MWTEECLIIKRHQHHFKQLIGSLGLVRSRQRSHCEKVIISSDTVRIYRRKSWSLDHNNIHSWICLTVWCFEPRSKISQHLSWLSFIYNYQKLQSVACNRMWDHWCYQGKSSSQVLSVSVIITSKYHHLKTDRLLQTIHLVKTNVKSQWMEWAKKTNKSKHLNSTRYKPSNTVWRKIYFMKPTHSLTESFKFIEACSVPHCCMTSLSGLRTFLGQPAGKNNVLFCFYWRCG